MNPQLLQFDNGVLVYSRGADDGDQPRTAGPYQLARLWFTRCYDTSMPLRSWNYFEFCTGVISLEHMDGPDQASSLLFFLASLSLQSSARRVCAMLLWKCQCVNPAVANAFFLFHRPESAAHSSPLAPNPKQMPS